MNKPLSKSERSLLLACRNKPALVVDSRTWATARPLARRGLLKGVNAYVVGYPCGSHDICVSYETTASGLMALHDAGALGRQGGVA